MTEDESWKMGEDIFDKNSSFDCIRDITNPTSTRVKSAFPREEWNALKGALDRSENIYEEHRFSQYISHAAYLMKKNGLSWEELRKLWYQTIHKNVYTPTPKFSDVRREVMRAAEAIPSLRAKKQIIEDAFDAVGIYEPVILSGKVLDAVTYKPIADVYIAATTLSVTFTIADLLMERSAVADEYDTDSNGNFSLRLGKTKYNIEGGYSLGESEESIEFTFPIDLSRDRVITILLSRDGTVSLDNLPDMPTPTSPDIPVPVVSGDIPIDEAHFPDAEFRRYLHDNFDALKDDVLSPSEVSSIKKIDLSKRIRYYYGYERAYKIESLSGIKHFRELEELLYLDFDDITSGLDVSGLQHLRRIDSSGRLASLNVQGCTNLVEITLGWPHNLVSLDVSGLRNLQILKCSGYNDGGNRGRLRELIVNGCLSLAEVDCSSQKMETLDLSGCIALRTLNCSRNYLNTLGVSGCAALTHLSCGGNQLTTLDVSSNTALTELWCGDNQLTALDVSGCTALAWLSCLNNQLEALDLSNCPYLSNYNVTCDKGVIVTWHSGEISTASAHLASQSGSSTANDSAEVLATLPAFTPTQSGTYTFTVSLDRTPPEDSSLLLLSDSEDLNASFALTDGADTVSLSADFTAGKTYVPVIVAETEQQEQSGGCNSDVLGMVLLVVLLKKRRC